LRDGRAFARVCCLSNSRRKRTTCSVTADKCESSSAGEYWPWISQWHSSETTVTIATIVAADDIACSASYSAVVVAAGDIAWNTSNAAIGIACRAHIGVAAVVIACRARTCIDAVVIAYSAYTSIATAVIACSAPICIDAIVA